MPKAASVWSHFRTGLVASSSGRPVHGAGRRVPVGRHAASRGESGTMMARPSRQVTVEWHADFCAVECTVLSASNACSAATAAAERCGMPLVADIRVPAAQKVTSTRRSSVTSRPFRRHGAGDSDAFDRVERSVTDAVRVCTRREVDRTGRLASDTAVGDRVGQKNRCEVLTPVRSAHYSEAVPRLSIAEVDR